MRNTVKASTGAASAEGSHDHEVKERAGGCDGDSGGEVARLRLALEKAEERARVSELALSEVEERWRREEARAQGLEQRVAELQRLLSAEAGIGKTPLDVP